MRTANASPVDERSRRVARRFEPWLLLAAVLVIPTIAIEASEPSEPWSTVALTLNWVIWLAFATELIVMLAIVPKRGRWLVEHPLEVAVVVLTAPFLPAVLQALRAARLLRLFRLVRLLPIVRGVRLGRRLFSPVGLRLVAVIALVTIIVGGTAFATVEEAQGLTAWDGLWWAVTTATTVGYGDISPATDTGRVIAIAVMIVSTVSSRRQRNTSSSLAAGVV